MKKLIILIWCMSAMTVFAQSQLDTEIKSIHQDSTKQLSPYLTTDTSNQPVLCWTSQKVGEKKHFLSYSLWDSQTHQFLSPQEIETTYGMQNHHESMGKIAFLSNGTMLAVFGVKKPTPKNRFAGYVAVTKSQDGIHWSKSQKLVNDTTSQSQRFFDVQRLSNGMVGMSWLDNRKMEPQKDGSTLYFGMTDEKGDFVSEKPIAGSTCQCCRTDIFEDKDSIIHIAFRDIIQDSIRDMMHLISKNYGKTFSPINRISEDNWIINGCPHTGPSIANNHDGLAYAWFTAGGGDGVYFAKAEDNHHTQKRILISKILRHPQMIGLNDNRYILVGNEFDHIGDIYFGRISLYVIQSDGTFKKYFITKKDSDNSHPVIIKINNDKILVAWTKHLSDFEEVNYTVLDTKEL